MKKRLNITNGDIAVAKMQEAGISGKTIAWNDVLHEGPVNASLSLSDLSELRALFIAERGWDDFEHVSGDFALRDRTLGKVDTFGEVVLWFEDDLYDQLQLLQLLDFFAQGGAHKAKVSLIQVKGFLPSLSKAALGDLDADRKPVTTGQLDLGARAWAAFGAADPSALSRLIGEDTAALPYLAAALTRHLEEFPGVSGGLSRSEAEAMAAIEAGHATPVAAFLAVAKKEKSVFLGDIVFYWYLERLSDSDTPLVTWKDGTRVIAPRGKEDSREFVTGELSLTPLGREVMAGKKDWQRITKNSRWLGGVEIKPGADGWRWDPGAQKLTHSSTRG